MAATLSLGEKNMTKKIREPKPMPCRAEELPAIADQLDGYWLASGAVWYLEWDIVRDGDQTFRSLEEYANRER